MADFVYKTQPLPHQRTVLRESATKAGWAWLLDPGLGKSFLAICNFAWAYKAKTIDAVLIISPNSVHHQWAKEEIPKHCPDDVAKELRSLVWISNKAKTKRAKTEREEFLKHRGLAVLCMSFEGTITRDARKFLDRFMSRRKVFLVVDESHRIKSLQGATKIWVTALGRKAIYRRALTGTPLEKPEDVYAQLRFLDNAFWERRGMKTSTEFKQRFCVFKGREVPDKRPGARPGNRMMIQQVVGAKNLEELARHVASISHRLTLDSAGVVLPTRAHQTYTYDLSPEQRRVYDELEEASRTILESGDELKVDSIMVKMLRLQQIVCGYVACEAEDPVQDIEQGSNRRLELLLDEILPSLPHQTIIWSRFTRDIELITTALGKDAVRFDGKISEADKNHHKALFQSGSVKYLVGNQDSGGTGLNLQNACYMIFHANNFRYITREQAERRIFRLGQQRETLVIDIEAKNTIDKDITRALRKKMDVATAILQNSHI